MKPREKIVFRILVVAAIIGGFVGVFFEYLFPELNPEDCPYLKTGD